jgi:predicted ArsR family transcriptional regulator
MTTLQVQARALGDPTRHEIFRFLADASRPVEVSELTSHLGLNHNAIRQHLAKLVEAELVSEGKRRSTRPGRPRLCYSVKPSADDRWGVTGPYERLALLMSEVIRTGDTPVEVGRNAGRRLRLGAAPSDDPFAEVVDQMARQGFDPIIERGEGALVAEVVLRSCPFASIALVDPETVCGLHLGLAHGLADAVGGVVIESLTPRDPRRAHCRLRCQSVPERADRG